MASLDNTLEIRSEQLEDVTISHDYLDHARKVNDVFYDQIVISDQKAAYIFTFMLAFLLTSADGRQVFTLAHYAKSDVLNGLISALLGLSSIVSSLCAILVVLPQHVKKSTSLFWGTWPQHRPHLQAAARAGDKNYLFQQYLDNADILSTIARRKYRFVTFAFRALVVTVLAYVVLLVIS